jgi:PLP dependent protein
VESVDTTRKADQLEKGRANLLSSTKTDQPATNEKLRIFIQVNTSGETTKSGCTPPETPDLCRHVIENCPHLQLQGLMTIGALARSQTTSETHPNLDFITLRQTRDHVVETLGLPFLELSMGMSEDFEGAVREGSTEIRVGSTIFGERPPKKNA